MANQKLPKGKDLPSWQGEGKSLPNFPSIPRFESSKIKDKVEQYCKKAKKPDACLNVDERRKRSF